MADQFEQPPEVTNLEDYLEDSGTEYGDWLRAIFDLFVDEYYGGPEFQEDDRQYLPEEVARMKELLDRLEAGESVDLSEIEAEYPEFYGYITTQYDVTPTEEPQLAEGDNIGWENMSEEERNAWAVKRYEETGEAGNWYNNMSQEEIDAAYDYLITDGSPGLFGTQEGIDYTTPESEPEPELTEWQTNKDYIVSQCTDGTCPNADMQAWYDRWVFSGMPETKDGMQSVEDYEAATQPQDPVIEEPIVEEPQGPTIEDLIAEYGEDAVNTAQGIIDDLQDKVGGTIDRVINDPLGVLKDVAEAVVGIDFEECSWTQQCNDENGQYSCAKECVNLGTILAIPGLDLPFPGGLIDASIRDLENILIETGKTIEDIFTQPIEDTIGDIVSSVKDTVTGILGGVDDPSFQDLYDILGSVVGAWMRDFVIDEFKDTISYEDPFLYDSLTTESCKDPEYAEQNEEQCAAVETVEEEEEVIDDITIDTTEDNVGDACVTASGEQGTLQSVGGLTLGGESSDDSQLECVPTGTEEVEEDSEEQQEVQLCQDPNRQTNTDGSCAEDCKFGFELNAENVCVEIEFDEGVEVNECTNGATNYPDCNQCPPGYVMGGLTFGGGSGECVRETTIIEDPECNDCSCNDYAAANPLECGWEECPDGSFAPTLALCGSGGEECPEGTVPCEALGGECTTPEACPGTTEEEEGGASGGGGGGSKGSLFEAYEPKIGADPQLLARQEFPITDFLMGLFTGK